MTAIESSSFLLPIIEKMYSELPNFKCFIDLSSLISKIKFLRGVGVSVFREGHVENRAKTGKNAQFSRVLRGDF